MNFGAFGAHVHPFYRAHQQKKISTDGKDKKNQAKSQVQSRGNRVGNRSHVWFKYHLKPIIYLFKSISIGFVSQGKRVRC